MTKEVLLTVSGLHFDGEGEKDGIEVVTTGSYYQKNGKHYVIYNEVMEGFEGVTKNCIKIGDKTMDITKKGVSNVHMVFEENKKNVTYYNTPFGSLLVGVFASKIEFVETEENIDITVKYALDVNYEHLADCNITVNIKSSNAKDFTLLS